MVFKVRKRNVDPIPPLREEVDHRRAEQVEVVLGNHLLQFRRRPIEMQNEFNFRGANIFQDVAQLADLEEPEAVRASKILMQQAVTAEALLTVWNKGLVGLEAHAAYLVGRKPHLVLLAVRDPFDRATNEAPANQFQQQLRSIKGPSNVEG